MTKSFPFSSFSGHFRFHLYRCLMSWPRQCLPDGLQSDPSLQRLPENILRALEAIFGLLVVESLIFGWIFGGYWCHAFVIWPILGCFYIFFCRKAKPLPPLPEHVMAWVHNADGIWVAMMMTIHKRYSLTETQHSKRCLPKRKFHLPTCIFLVLCFFSGVYQIDRSISD